MRQGRFTEGGMTLVEIMITMVISSIVAASTFMFFAGQQRIYDTQTKLLNIQQNLWASMEVVARYTRASGSGMYECVRPASRSNSTAQNGSRLLNTSPSPNPLANDLSVPNRPQTGIRAFDSSTGSMQWIPPLWIVNRSSGDVVDGFSVVPNTDILTVAFGNRTSGTYTDATLKDQFPPLDGNMTTAISLLGTNTGNMFRRGEFILLLVTPDWGYGTDPTGINGDRGCTLFQVTSTDPNNTSFLAHDSSPIKTGDLVWNPGNSAPAMLPNGGDTYVGGAAGVRNFGQLAWVTFFVSNGPGGIPNLMMKQRHLAGASGQAQVLAEGIEDLQISFACDTGVLGSYDLTTVNGQLDEGTDDTTRRTDEWWNNVPLDNLPLVGSAGYCNMPTAVRLTFVARSLAPDDLIDTATSNGPMDVEDHRYTNPRPTDQYRRRVLSTTVYPRNNRSFL
ncbi:MAG TPA: PilW family protein [Polyangia bacterium]